MRRIAVFTVKGVAVLTASAVLAGTGVAWSTKLWYDSRFEKVEALDERSPDIRRPQAQRGAENFLLVGSDSRQGDNAIDAPGVTGARSDTVMIAHVPADRSRAVVVSFPRDLEIDRPSCRRWDSRTGDYRDEVTDAAAGVKLNTAYAFGGPRCVTKVVQKLTGMRINHFVGVDFSGFKHMVDAVGGVTMQVAEPVIDKHRGAIVEEPGRVTFDGDRALRFVRARYVRGDSRSDYGRIERQQQFIAALLGRAMSSEVLFDRTRLDGFVTAFTEATFTDNIGVDPLITLARSLKASAGTERIVFRTVPTTGGANARGNEVLVASDTEELFSALIDNRALPKEG